MAAGFHISGATAEKELQKRDATIETLATEVDQLKQKLDATTADHDLLRNVQANSEDNMRDKTTLFAKLGRSTAKIIEDPRIGKPKRILVVGGGPSGLIALHEILNPLNRPKGERLEDFHVELYERKAEVGGVWYFEPDNYAAKGWSPSISETSHPSSNGATVNGNCDSSSTQTTPKPRWPSPAYNGLVGNVLPRLLQFSQHKLPEKFSAGLFPSMVETHQYLLDVAAPLRTYIKTSREVVECQPLFRSKKPDFSPAWSVTSRDWSDGSNGKQETEGWDAVIIATGYNDHPWYPSTTGLDGLLAAKSPLVLHAKHYAGPLPFVNRHNKVVVVGNANSANDICAHLAPLNSGPLYRSQRHESNFAHLKDEKIVNVNPVAGIVPSANGQTLDIRLSDDTQIEGVTKLIFATGYQFHYPWLLVPGTTTKLNSSPSSDSSLPQPELFSASTHGAVGGLYKSTFHATCPSLSFIGLSACSHPLPLAEIQARTVSRVIHNVLALPPTSTLHSDFSTIATTLSLDPSSPARWRQIHMLRGAAERALTGELLEWLERGEEGGSDGLFRWDEEREGIAKRMRAVKEGELRRLREARLQNGGVDGGPGGVLGGGFYRG